MASGDQGALRENTGFPFYQVRNVLVTDLKADPGFALRASVPTYGA